MIRRTDNPDVIARVLANMGIRTVAPDVWTPAHLWSPCPLEVYWLRVYPTACGAKVGWWRSVVRWPRKGGVMVIPHTEAMTRFLVLSCWGRYRDLGLYYP